MSKPITKREIVKDLNAIADNEIFISHRTSEVLREAAKRIVIDDTDRFIAWLWDNRYVNCNEWSDLNDLAERWKKETDGQD